MNRSTRRRILLGGATGFAVVSLTRPTQAAQSMDETSDRPF